MSKPNLTHLYYRTPEHIDWVISPLPLRNANWGLQLNICDDGPMCILGFHRSSMELKHTYGPFRTPEEMVFFAREHKITLPGMN
jgi:hypothetical protein